MFPDEINIWIGGFSKVDLTSPKCVGIIQSI